MRTSVEYLESIARAYGIKIIYNILSQGLFGQADAEAKTITLDPSVKENFRQHICILAEEIGHVLFPPRPGHIRYHSRGFYETENCSVIKHNVAQDERKARDWATCILMPDVEFNRIMENGGYSINEIMELYEVERWFALHRIALYRRKQESAGRKVPKWKDLIRREKS